MSAHPDPSQLARQWVERAEDDLRAAEYTLTMPEGCPFAVVCFHSQQAVEKFIKALLVYRSIDFPRVHDVSELVRLLPREIAFPLSALEQERLTDHATVSRDPGDWEPFSRSDADQAVAAARTVREAMRAHLPREILQG